jgi:hypothetical protein
MWNTRGGSCGSAVALLLLQLSGTWEPITGQLIDRNCFGSENATLSGRNRFAVPFFLVRFSGTVVLDVETGTVNSWFQQYTGKIALRIFMFLNQ